jgi:hypothetical protein
MTFAPVNYYLCLFGGLITSDVRACQPFVFALPFRSFNHACHFCQSLIVLPLLPNIITHAYTLFLRSLPYWPSDDAAPASAGVRPCGAQRTLARIQKAKAGKVGGAVHMYTSTHAHFILTRSCSRAHFILTRSCTRDHFTHSNSCVNPFRDCRYKAGHQLAKEHAAADRRGLTIKMPFQPSQFPSHDKLYSMIIHSVCTDKRRVTSWLKSAPPPTVASRVARCAR